MYKEEGGGGEFMSYYAYEDEERNIEVLAQSVNDDNKLEHYFCPTENCAARMSIRNIHGDGRAYFAANPSTPHSNFCRINRCTSKTQHDEEQFNFNNFMDNLMSPNIFNNGNGDGEHGNGDGQIRPITTVRQLYSVCIQRSINQLYNGIRIADLLIDRRTRHIYFNYIRGNHLVECQFWRYKKENHLYYAKYWLDDGNDNYLTIRLICLNDGVFDKIFKKVFKRSFVVAGNWEMNGNICEVNIVNSKQVYALSV